MRTIFGTVTCCVVVVVLSACGPDASPVQDPSSGEIRALEATDCPRLLGDGVISALGWSGADEATYAGSEECARVAAEGAVVITRRPVPAVGGSDLPEKAEATFKDRCMTLQATEGADFLDLADGSRGCTALEGGRGTSSLILLTDADEVLEIRVDADLATPAARVESGIAVAGAAADKLF